MTNDPDKLRREIEDTRARMSYDVNALADEADPRNVAQRQVDKAKDSVQSGLQSVKEKIMGSDDTYDSRYGYASTQPSVGERVQGAAGDARHALEQTPYRVKRQTRGNPLAAGLIAFGLGALLGSLMPVTDKERELSRQLKDQAQPVVDEAQALARQAVEELKPAAQDAVESVKLQADDGVQAVKADAHVAKGEVQDQAQQSKANVQDERRQP